MTEPNAEKGTGKALKEVLRAHRPDPDLADEVRELRKLLTSEWSLDHIWVWPSAQSCD
jgi:hypothetical protein